VALRVVAALNTSSFRRTVADSRRRLFFLCGILGFAFWSAGAVAQAGNYSSAAAYIYGAQTSALDEVIAAYERIEAAGGWPAVSADETLVPGGRSPLVRSLRQRLRLTGDFTGRMSADPFLFDRALLDALQQFQLRHGLQPSGYIDRQTLYTLNQPVGEKLALLRDARERWSALKPYAGDARIWVNIPEARVAALENNTLMLNMRAIVGQRSRQTPELSSTIRRVVVNPNWTVPRSIATQDLLPKQQADPGYLSRNNIRVYSTKNRGGGEIAPTDINWSALSTNNFPYQLKQDPGPANSLGRLKFDFANSYDVFLHDTPGKALLGLSYRSLSSGCVRLSEPEPLAAWMLGSAAQAKLLAALGDNTYSTQSLEPKTAVAIEMVYLVAWVSEANGTVQFRSDVYQKVSY